MKTVRTLIIINDPPYGTERPYNALRLAHALRKANDKADVSVFLMADAVAAAKRGQQPPAGYYNVEKMLHRVSAGGGAILLCGSCMDARGLTDDELIEGARRSSMDELAAATLAANRVLVF
jgi:uncharacterized protein involved in oxidation of intracellular sulfur